MNQNFNSRGNAILKDTSTQDGNPEFFKQLYTVLGLIFFIIGVILVVLQSIEYANYKKIYDGGQYTYGVITDVTREIEDNNGEESEIYYYIQGNYDVAGETYEFYFKSSTSEKEGDSIKLFYEEGNPSNYVQEDFSEARYIVGIMCLGVSFILSIFAYKNYLVLKNKKSEITCS